jgi:alkylhydroperoxidase/carboxymuconolactone decarboxylase family protein YurZ
MGLFTPKRPPSDTPGATTAPVRQSRRQQRQAAQAQQRGRERTRELQTIAVAVRNGGDTDLNAFRKVAGRMMPGATDAEIRAAHAQINRR